MEYFKENDPCVKSLSNTEVINHWLVTGKPKFFDLFYDNHAMKGEMIAYRMLGNKYEAEEAVSEVCLHLIENRTRIKPVRNVDAWFAISVVNKCKEFLRQRQRRHHESLSENLGMVREVTFDSFDREFLYQVIHELNNASYRHILLAELMGYSNSEIAKQLNLTTKKVTDRKSRAKKILRSIIKRYIAPND